MKNLNLSINPSQLNRDGVRLRQLATLGQSFLVLGMLATPFILYAIQLSNTEGSIRSFPLFIEQIYLSGPMALVNFYGLIKSCVVVTALDYTRRLGLALSGTDPLGNDTLRHLRWLSYTLVALVLLLCFSVETFPVTALQSSTFKTRWTVSSSPLYLGALVWLGLSIVRRVVAQAAALKAESEAFV
jgi:hypothetical protein